MSDTAKQIIIRAELVQLGWFMLKPKVGETVFELGDSGSPARYRVTSIEPVLTQAEARSKYPAYHPPEACERRTGYNAAAWAAVEKDLLGPVEQRRFATTCPPWARSVIANLVTRIMYLRQEIADIRRGFAESIQARSKGL